MCKSIEVGECYVILGNNYVYIYTYIYCICTCRDVHTLLHYMYVYSTRSMHGCGEVWNPSRETVDGIKTTCTQFRTGGYKICILKHNTFICQRLQLVSTVVCTLQMPAIGTGDYTSVPKVTVIGIQYQVFSPLCLG